MLFGSPALFANGAPTPAAANCSAVIIRSPVTGLVRMFLVSNPIQKAKGKGTKPPKEAATEWVWHYGNTYQKDFEVSKICKVCSPSICFCRYYVSRCV